MTRAARASLARSGLRLPASRAGRRDAPRGTPVFQVGVSCFVTDFFRVGGGDVLLDFVV